MTDWRPVTRGESGAGVFRNADGSRYAKVVDAEAVADLVAERDRVSWAHGHGLPVPAVIDWGSGCGAGPGVVGARSRSAGACGHRLG
ncbi:hypothetical protein [Mycolicibacterium peregrinum]|uniref:hypothetical protein n=1 Tax=Mycolicibacterium peregrinum TaxID=43304 RepID=UPI000B19EEB4|nr:hypothetical protein [Mycolicibacterium peregrinum]